jgi:ParB-like chromosome segregation protein Spo0J
MKIESRHYNELRPAEWRVNHVFKPELKMLADSITKHGWLQPIVVMQDGLIVDGTARWYLAQSSKPIFKRDAGQIPVVLFDGDEIDAMVAHLRLNRARGVVIPRSLSVLVRDVVRSGKYTLETLQKELRFSSDELSVLVEGSLLKVRKIDEYNYSKSWVPIESNGTVVPPSFERPPNKDT